MRIRATSRLWTFTSIALAMGFLGLALSVGMADGTVVILAGLGSLSCLLLFFLHLACRGEIRERIRVEEALRGSESRFRDFFEHVQEGVYRSSRDGRIIAANPALLALFGVESKAQLDSLTASELYVHPAERTLLTSKLEEHGFLTNEELRLKRFDGQEITVLENARAVTGSSGDLLYYEGTLVDITARKMAEIAAAQDTSELEASNRKLEAQAGLLLEQSRELAAARDTAVETSRLKSEFLANLSHEIRTPLNGVVGMSDLLLSTDLTPQQQEFAETVTYSASNLLATISDILDYLKIEARQVVLASAPFSLREAFSQVLESYALEAEAKGLELVLNVQAGLADHVLGDRARLAQILQNLVRNSVRASDSGAVIVTAGCSRETDSEVTVRVQVEDSGQGIPPGSSHRLFEPFARLQPLGSDAFATRGLGLAISKELVETMGGQIGVQSEPGQGSAFWFQVRLPKQSIPVEQKDHQDTRLAGRSVLVVDDVAGVRAALAGLLSGWGMEALTAADGGRALQLLAHPSGIGSTFDFVLLDYKMPGVSTFAMVETIQAFPGPRPAIVLLTPYSSQTFLMDRLPEGIHSLLPKPVNEARLRQCLLNAIGPGQTNGDLQSIERTLSHHSPASASILIAEDNLVNQRVAVRLVEKMGHSAQVVSNGAEVLEALRISRFDMILMDCQMPILDGFEATREIRRLEADRHRLPIIAMTAHAMYGDRERCMAAGMDDYISKPVTYDDLQNIIGSWLQKSKSAAAG